MVEDERERLAMSKTSVSLDRLRDAGPGLCFECVELRERERVYVAMEKCIGPGTWEKYTIMLFLCAECKQKVEARHALLTA